MDIRNGIAEIVAAHKSIPLANAPIDVVEAGEIVKARTASMKVFKGADGQRRAIILPEGVPFHWKNGKGEYRAVDLAVKRKPTADPLQQYQYEVKSGVYHAHFDKNKPWNYRLDSGDGYVEYEALFDESDDLDIEVEALRTGIKETITLRTEKAPTELSWRVKRSGDGIITPQPEATDANGDCVEVVVSQDDKGITYIIDTDDAVFPITIDPTSVVATNDGYVESEAATYALARDVAAGDTKTTTAFRVGQHIYDFGGTVYNVCRGFASFAIPNVTITGASLFLDGISDGSTDDFDIYIHESTYSDPLVKEDFDQFDGWQASGAYTGTVLNNTWNSTSYSANWNEIVFNATGIAAISAKKGSTFKCVVMSKNDYDDAGITNPEYINFNSSATAGKEPYLELTFTQSISLGGTLTPAGSLSAIITFVQGLSGGLGLSGELTASNPAWLMIDDVLTWKGEWDAAYPYDVDDVVLYKYGSEWHVFVSKIGHNVGNIPTSSAEAWRRLFQEPLS